MSASVLLTLDTQAPVVTWGAISGTHGDETLHVAYTLDEPALDAAALHLSDSRVLAMDLHDGYLTVELPFDTPDGPAIIRAHVIDDVGNEAEWTLTISLGAAVGPPVSAPAPTVGGMPQAPARLRHVVSVRSGLRARTRARLRASSARRDPHALPATRASITAHAASASPVRAASHAVVTAHQTEGHTHTVADGKTTVSRRDDETWLVLLLS